MTVGRSAALLALSLAPLLACDSRGSGITGVLRDNPPSLSGLTLTAGTLTPTFNATTSAYSANVSNATTSIRVIPSVSRTDLTISVNGTPVASGSASNDIPLVVGTNNIAIEVRNASNGVRNYTVSVRRSG